VSFPQIGMTFDFFELSNDDTKIHLVTYIDSLKGVVNFLSMVQLLFWKKSIQIHEITKVFLFANQCLDHHKR